MLGSPEDGASILINSPTVGIVDGIAIGWEMILPEIAHRQDPSAPPGSTGFIFSNLATWPPSISAKVAMTHNSFRQHLSTSISFHQLPSVSIGFYQHGGASGIHLPRGRHREGASSAPGLLLAPLPVSHHTATDRPSAGNILYPFPFGLIDYLMDGEKEGAVDGPLRPAASDVGGGGGGGPPAARPHCLQWRQTEGR